MRLLVVDDSALLRRLLGEVFRAAGGFEIAFARDGEEALAALPGFRPDVVTLDIQMPRMGGLACLDRIMLEHPVPVVVLSSGGDEPVPDEGKDGHSIFTWNLIQVIGSVQDWKPGSTVFSSVRASVRKEFPQTPKYGSLTAAGHQAGGEYLFESRSN